MNRNLRQNSLKLHPARERFRRADEGPLRPMRDATPINDIIPEILDANSRQPDTIPPELIDHWPLIAGTQVAQHTRPARLKDGILYVYANHPGWLSELRRLPKNHLIRKASQIEGAGPVRDIRFQLNPEY